MRQGAFEPDFYCDVVLTPLETCVSSSGIRRASREPRAASLGRSWEKSADYFHQTGLDGSKSGSKVRPLRDAIVVSKVQNIIINHNMTLRECLSEGFQQLHPQPSGEEPPKTV